MEVCLLRIANRPAASVFHQVEKRAIDLPQMHWSRSVFAFVTTNTSRISRFTIRQIKPVRLANDGITRGATETISDLASAIAFGP
jgi:hypothetical protein